MNALRSALDALSAARRLLTQIDADDRISLPPDVLVAVLTVREDCRHAEECVEREFGRDHAPPHWMSNIERFGLVGEAPDSDCRRARA